MSNQLLGDVKVEERVQTVTSKGSDPAFFSCWDMHSYYGESYIVQGINFDIREGEVVALLGRNGAGKTSTLRSIARVDSLRLPTVKSGWTISLCTLWPLMMRLKMVLHWFQKTGE